MMRIMREKGEKGEGKLREDVNAPCELLWFRWLCTVVELGQEVPVCPLCVKTREERRL